MIVNGSKPLTFITKSSILDGAAVLDLSLPFMCQEKHPKTGPFNQSR